MGVLADFFAADHRRLDRLLDRATAQAGQVDLVAFGSFRAGLLKHIGMEEKVLLPAARRARGGEALPLARRIHAEHGAIASLLVPTPTPAVVDRLVSILGPHNLTEEEAGGLYEQCDELLANQSASLL